MFARGYRHRAFSRPALRPGRAETLLVIQDDPSFPEPYRFLAACYAHMGRLGRGARDRPAAARHHTDRHPGCVAMAQSRAPGALPIWPAAGCWRDDVNATRRLAAILA